MNGYPLYGYPFSIIPFGLPLSMNVWIFQMNQQALPPMSACVRFQNAP